MKRDELNLTPEEEAAIDRALASDLGPQPNEAIAVRYSKASDAFVMTLRSGLVMHIPKHMIEELDNVPSGSPILSRVIILGRGFALAWDDIDESVKVADLIANALSQAPTASQMGKRGGSVRTDKKAASSRENGRKGGRPRKAIRATLMKPGNSS